MVDRNQTQAAIRAGYAKVSARQQGANLMAQPYIQTEIDKLIAAAQQGVERRVELAIKNKAEWLERVAAIADADITDAFQPDANGKLSMTITELKQSGFGKLIRKMKVMPNGKVEFELHPKIPALELLARGMNWITDQVSVDISGSLAQAPLVLAEQDFKKIFEDPEVEELVLKLAEKTAKPPQPANQSPVLLPEKEKQS